MGFVYNTEQRGIINEAVHWFRNSSEQVFQFAGGPGRGKSVVMGGILDELGLPINQIAPMSFMGSAALVMRTKGLLNAKTIHSWLFNPVQAYKYDRNGNLITNDYFDRPKFDIAFEPKPLDGKVLILIDEGGTVPYNLKEEIESRGIKIIVCGDLDQLPPVGDTPAYLYSGKVHMLTQPMRQAYDSFILYLAERAINGQPIHKGLYKDCLVISEDELIDDMILSSDVIICGKNNTRDKFNKHVRHDILNIYTDLPAYGERMVCRKNNWNIEVDGINLTNGLTGTVVNMPGVDSFDGKTFKIDFKPNILEACFPKLSCDYNYLIAPHEQKQLIKSSKYNYGEKFEFAYAITCHMSQGMQFNNGIYFEEYLNKDIQKNLDYTGITRFSRGLIYVKRKRKFY